MQLIHFKLWRRKNYWRHTPALLDCKKGLIIALVLILVIPSKLLMGATLSLLEKNALITKKLT
jgi:hypothetical protein